MEEAAFAAAHNRGEEIGATYDLYSHGIDIPPGFKRPAAPSKHSGDNSLSPHDPENDNTNTVTSISISLQC